MLKDLSISKYLCVDPEVAEGLYYICWLLDRRVKMLNGRGYGQGVKAIDFTISCFPDGLGLKARRCYNKEKKRYSADVMLEHGELRGLNREEVYEVAVRKLLDEVNFSFGKLRMKKELLRFDFDGLANDIRDVVMVGELNFEGIPPFMEPWMEQVVRRFQSSKSGQSTKS